MEEKAQTTSQSAKELRGKQHLVLTTRDDGGGGGRRRRSARGSFKNKRETLDRCTKSFFFFQENKKRFFSTSKPARFIPR
jgi:hypothetical protein